MKKKLVTIFTIAVTLLFNNCAPTKILPLSDSNNRYGLTQDEINLIEQSELYIKQLESKGLLYTNDSINQYIYNIGENIIPQNLTKNVNFSFYILKDPSINAFSLPNGQVLIHIGLLCNLETEGQLAFVISHEISHVILRHMLQNYIHSKRKIVASKVAGLFLTPIDVFTMGLTSGVIYLSALSSINGYGREKEIEADELGYTLLINAGYDSYHAINLFDKLNEIEDMGGLEYFFYSSHPSNKMRQDNLKSLITDTLSSFEAFDSSYMKRMKDLMIYNVELRIKNKHYQYALKEVNDLIKMESLYNIKECYKLLLLKGDIYQKMSSNIKDVAFETSIRNRENYNDALIDEFKQNIPQYQDSAVVLYQKLIKQGFYIHQANRGLGIIAYANNDFKKAKEYLQNYLQSDENIIDKRYIEHLINQINIKNNESY